MLRLLSLDFVSTMAVECGEASWDMDESSSLWIWPGPNSFSIVGWEVSFQVYYLRCPNKIGIPKQSPGEE